MIHCHAGITGLQDGLSRSALKSHTACQKSQNQIQNIRSPPTGRITPHQGQDKNHGDQNYILRIATKMEPFHQGPLDALESENFKWL